MGIAMVVAPETMAAQVVHLAPADEAGINELRGFVGASVMMMGVFLLLGALRRGPASAYYLRAVYLLAAVTVLFRIIDFAIGPVSMISVGQAGAEAFMAVCAWYYAEKVINVADPSPPFG